MNNKKSLLQDSLQELENIKNESLELAKEQLINESADLLEKKSAALFEKLIAGEDMEESIDEDSSVNETIEELKKLSEEESDEDDEEMTSDDEESSDEDDMEMSSDDEEMTSDDEEMDLDALRKAAEEHGFKLVQADSDEDEEDSENVSDSDEEDMDSDEEDLDDSDDEEDIQFGNDDDEEFSDVEVDDKVLAEAFSNKKINRKKQINEALSEKQMQAIQNWIDKVGERGAAKKLVDIMISSQTGGLTSSDLGDTAIFADGLDEIESLLEDGDFETAISVAKDTAANMLEDEGFGGFGLDESLKRNNTKMRNTKKQVLKDLRDVSFNKLVEAYYNMDEEDSFVVKEDEYMDDDMPDYSNIGQLEEYVMDEDMYDEGYDMDDDLPSSPTGGEYGGEYGDLGEEDVMYEIDMPEGGYGMESMSDEGYMDEMSDEDINEMLAEMDIEEAMHDGGMRGLESESIATRTRDKFVKNPGMPKGSIAQRSELEEMFEEMSMEELEEMNAMLEGGDMPSMPTKTLDSSMEEATDLTEAEIEEMLSSMKEEEDIEEGMSIRRSQSNKHQAPSPRNREERIRPLAEEADEDVESLKEQLKKLKQENKSLNEGFVNKVKSLENKVYDVTISALKAGFVNKFLLEHPLRENEKLEIIHRFSNAQTKEQIKETYVSLTNEFAKKQTVKDGSMLNESVQNKVGRIHRTDNVVVTEKNLINENSETNRFKQLLNYNFGRK